MSLQLLNLFERANNGIAALVERALWAFLASLNPARPEAVKLDLFNFVPVLIAQYGDMAATVAADWYDEMRASEGVPGSFRAPLADLVPDEQVNARIGYVTRPDGPLFSGDFETLKTFTTMIANEYALQPGRDTVMQAAHKDKAAYARVPEPGACDFCLMLASRGFVYSKATAGETDKFHGNCRCNVMPVWNATRARTEFGYNPDALYEQYLEKQGAKRAATRNGTKPQAPSGDATNLRAQLASLERSLPILKARAADGDNVSAAIKWQTDRIAAIKRQIR
jgi:hypothetical protein